MVENYFCENIKYLRSVNNLTREELAKRSGISVENLSALENGEIPPAVMLDVVFELERCFGIKAYRFFMKNCGN